MTLDKTVQDMIDASIRGIVLPTPFDPSNLQAQIDTLNRVFNQTMLVLDARVTKLETAPVPAPPPAPIPPPAAIWRSNFATFNVLSSANPNAHWDANAFWQSDTLGYEDFAGNSWNINPNDKRYPSPFTVNNGVLSIFSRRIPANLRASIEADMRAQGQTHAVPDWMGGFLTTNNGFNKTAVPKFKYGYIEAKLRFPVQGKGMFPAFWLYATEGGADPLGKGKAEIDIFEVFGIPNSWATNLHPGDAVGAPQVNQDLGSWHTYGLDWQPKYLRFYRDGVLVHEVVGAKAEYFNTTMGIMLNYSMDAPWFGASTKSDASTPDNLRMDVEYVQVLANKP